MFSKAVILGPVPKKYHSQLFSSFSSGSCSPGLGGKCATAHAILRDSTSQSATHSSGPTETPLLPTSPRDAISPGPSCVYYDKRIRKGVSGPCESKPVLRQFSRKRVRKAEGGRGKEGPVCLTDTTGRPRTTCFSDRKVLFQELGFSKATRS